MTAETRTLFLSLEKEEAVINEMKRRLVHLAESSYVNSDISHLLGRAPSGVFFANSHGQDAQDYIRSKLEVFHRVSTKTFGCALFFICVIVLVMHAYNNQNSQGHGSGYGGYN